MLVGCGAVLTHEHATVSHWEPTRTLHEDLSVQHTS